MARTRSKLVGDESARRGGQNGVTRTPTKTKIRAECALLPYLSPSCGIRSKIDVFRKYNIGKTRGFEILKEATDRTAIHGRDPSRPRGRPRKLTNDDLDRCEAILTSDGFESRSLTWQTLVVEANLPCCGTTLCRAMQRRGYKRCIACVRRFLDPRTRRRRVEWAEDMLSKYPRPEQWRHIRFSDETHFSYGPQGRTWIIRKPGERYCLDCTQFKERKHDSRRPKAHAWAAVGYNFKSKLYWHTPNAKNGKLTSEDYITILRDNVKPWLDEGQQFVLEEDQDSSHGFPPGNEGVVQDYKSEIGLRHYFNCSVSPDLSIAENAWQPMKSRMRGTPIFHKSDLILRAEECWERDVHQGDINKWVDSIPTRLREVIRRDGAMTHY